MKIAARLLSYLFHPLLVLTYGLIVLIAVDPFSFGANSIQSTQSTLLILRIFLSTFFIPAMAILMLYFLGMVKSLRLEDKMDRTGPYIITGIFYLWLLRNFWGSALVPSLYTAFMLGVTIALFLAFLINIFSKISIHAVGISALLAMIIITMLTQNYNTLVIPIAQGRYLQASLLYLLLALLLIAGLLGTSRLYLQKHELSELYGGYFVGFVSPFVALQIMLILGKLNLSLSTL
ncbi:MAG TPA: hypothetical protein VJ953_00610 [Saprospiraceae bacterium]|nr:hypothetical protein [Saprospiraceae bacterium]